MAEEIMLRSLLVGELPCDLVRVEKYEHEREEVILQRVDHRSFVFNEILSACIYKRWPNDLVDPAGFNCKSVGICRPNKLGVVRVIPYVIRGIPNLCDTVAFPFDVYPPLNDESGASTGGNGYRLVRESEPRYPRDEEEDAPISAIEAGSSKKRIAEEAVDATVMPISKRRKRNL
jgi:hypothetical protein